MSVSGDAGNAGAADRAPTGSARPDQVTDHDVPAADTILGWIAEIYRHGVRRPGYPADAR